MRLWKMAAAAAVLAGSAALGAPGAEAKGDLVVKRFLLGRLEANTDKFIATGGRGTTNAFRDNVIMFVFTAPVVPASGLIDPQNVSSRTIRIGIPSGPGLFIDADGEFYGYAVKEFDNVSASYVVRRTYRNRVIFDPTARMADDPTDKNPYGLLDNSLYSVTVPGVNTGETKIIKSVDGRPNKVTFTTTFKTTASYLQDYKQPSIAKIEGIDAPNIPLDGRTNVDSRADIVAFFSEPMLPSTFDPSTSFRVFNASVGKVVTGTIRAAPDGLSFTYRPAFGYGRGPSNITVTLTTAITDRSGNNLDKGLSVNFVSEFDAFAPSYQELLEDYVNNTYEDRTFTLASTDNGRAVWNGAVGQPPVTVPGTPPGSLQASYGTGTRELNFNSTNWVSPPYYSSYAHTQGLFTAAQMGKTARTIVGHNWHLHSGFTLATGTFVSTTVKMGHNTSGTLSATYNFAAAFSDTAVTNVNSANYTVTNAMNNGGWITGPTYTTNWPYNGVDNIVLDVNLPNSGGPYEHCFYGPTGNAGVEVMTVTGGGNLTFSGNTLDMRFLYLVDKCEAQSKWYDTNVPSPAYLAPIVLQSKPAGTVIILRFQGARPDPIVPGQVDVNSFSAWTTDPQADLSGFRYIRWNAEMQSNLTSGTKPQIDALTMPFVYF